MAENVGAVSFGVNLDNSGISSQVNSLGSSIGSTFKGILSNAFSFALGQGLFATITSGFKSSVVSAWDFNSTMQSATTSFTTLLHSAGEASTLVSQLNAIDQASTLDMTDLSKAAQEMISFGVNSSQVIPTIKELGDISQGNSEKFNALALAFSQTSSAGKLTGQDLLQYISAGFNPLQVIAQKTGKSMADLRDEMGKGQISAANVADAFKTATSAGGAFYNATANASKTYSGQMAMLGASVTETLGAMIKPAFTDFTNNVLPHLISVMGTVSDTFNATGSVTGAVAAGLKAAFGPEVSGAFTTIAAGVQGSIGWIAEHGTAVTTVVASIAGAMTAFKLATMAVNAVTAIHNGLLIISAIATGNYTIANGVLKTSTDVTTKSQWALNAAFLANPVTLVVVGIAALVAAFVVMWVKCAAFRDFWIGLGTDIANIAKTAVAAVVGFFEALPQRLQQIFNAVVGFAQQWGPLILTAVAPVIGIPLLIAQHWDQIKDTVSGVWNNVQHSTATAWNNIRTSTTSAVTTLGSGISIAWNGIQNGAATAWKAVVSVVTSIVRPFVVGILDFWRNMQGGLQQISTGIHNVISGAWKVISNEVLGIVLLFIDTLQGLFTGHWANFNSDYKKLQANITAGTRQFVAGIQQVFSGAWNVIVSVALTAWNHLTGNLTAAWNLISTAAQTVFNGLKSFFGMVGNDVQATATSTGNNVRSFFESTGNGIRDTAINTWNGIVGFFTGLPARIGSAADAVRSWVVGAWNGLISFAWSIPGSVGGAMDSAGSWIRGVWNGIVGFFWGLPGQIGGAAGSIGNAIVNGINGAIGWIRGLPGEAWQWGMDIINSIANGIRSAASAVGNAVNGVAQDIRKFLHFSEPDVGPLVGFHTWMPDFMGGLAADIQDNRNKVIGAMQGLTSGMSMTINPTASLALAGSGNKFAAKSQTSSGMGSPTYRQNINFNGNYTFRDQTDIDHFMNQSALLINRKR